MCSAGTSIECSISHPCCVGVFAAVLCKEEGSSLVSAITERTREICACIIKCPCMCVCWNGDYVSQLLYLWYFVVKAVLTILARNAIPRGPMCLGA